MLKRLTRRDLAIPAFAGLSLMGLVAAPGTESAAPSSAGQYQQTVQPVLQKNCYGCHNAKLKTADVDLASLKTEANVAHDPELWEKVALKLRNGTMPPKPLPRPKQADIETVTKWIDDEITRVEQATKPDPGRVTARRLNRTEYNNTVRDLLGVNFQPADDFPQDDSGYGFDNIGDVLSLSPVLMERYLNAAEKVVRMAIFGPEKMKPTVMRHQPVRAELALRQEPLTEYDFTGLSMPNALHVTQKFPVDAEYTVRVALEGRRPNGSEPLHVAVWLDGKQVQTLEINAPSDGGSIDLFGAQRECRVRIPAGEHWVAATFLRLYEGLPPSYGGPNPSQRPIPPAPDPMRFVKLPKDATPEQVAEAKKKAEARLKAMKIPANRVWVHYIEFIGPYEQATGPSPESRAKIFNCGHTNGKHTPACDRKILTQFARRAFRRPVTPEDVQPYLKLASIARQQGSSFDESIGVALQGILVSPDFLFRIERPAPAPKNQAAIVKTATEKTPAAPNGITDVEAVSQHALASRLSYFLWSSMPDDQLLDCADKGTLRKPEVLAAQVRRMLKDPKAQAFVENFAGQWLELRRLESVVPDPEKFPQFDDYLRMSMKKETELFFDSIMRDDRSILDLIDAKYTFVNQKLAEFYGLPGVKGIDFRKVDLTGTPRGGVLTHASVLTVSSYATRTSPVLRGKWILENFLNAPPPPPPPNVPALDEAKIGNAGSIRQQMEQHRANPMCASCHSKMDPLGFGFENFNAIGAWRTHDGKFPIDASGTLPDGGAFKGPDELKALLRGDKNSFALCVTDKMLTYALGRGLERYDRRTVKEIVNRISADDYKFTSLVLEIVNSLPFQMRRGEHAKS